MSRTAVRIKTLGGFAVLVSGRDLRLGRKVPRRPLDLLKYLAVHAGQPMSDVEVAGALWPGRGAVAALRVLAVTLHRLRRLLGHPEAILRQGGLIGVDPALVWCDAADFERTLALAARCRGRRERLRLTARALELYGGEFLPGEMRAPWAAPIRARLHAIYVSACREALDPRAASPDGRIRNRSVNRRRLTSHPQPIELADA